MCDRQMDRHTDRGVDTAAWSQLKYGPLVTISTQQLGVIGTGQERIIYSPLTLSQTWNNFSPSVNK